MIPIEKITPTTTTKTKTTIIHCGKINEERVANYDTRQDVGETLETLEQAHQQQQYHSQPPELRRPSNNGAHDNTTATAVGSSRVALSSMTLSNNYFNNNNHSGSSEQDSNEEPEKSQEEPETASLSGVNNEENKTTTTTTTKLQHDEQTRKKQKLTKQLLSHDTLTSLFAYLDEGKLLAARAASTHTHISRLVDHNDADFHPVKKELDQLIQQSTTNIEGESRHAIGTNTNPRESTSLPQLHHYSHLVNQCQQQVMPSFSVTLRSSCSESNKSNGEESATSTASSLTPREDELYIDVDGLSTRSISSSSSETLEANINNHHHSEEIYSNTLDSLWIECEEFEKGLAHKNPNLREQDQEFTYARTLTPTTQKHSNTLVILQHLIQKRNELKSIDRHLFNIMTRYLMQLERTRATNISLADSGQSLPILPASSTLMSTEQIHNSNPNTFGPSNHHNHGPPFMSNYDYNSLINTAYDCRQRSLLPDYSSMNDDQLNNVIDLSLMSTKFNGRSTPIVPSNSFKLQATNLSTTKNNTGNPTLEGNGSTTTTVSLISSNQSASNAMSSDMKKPSSVNLKKSRLLESVLASSTEQTRVMQPKSSTFINRPPHQLDQTIPLNLLKRCKTPSGTTSTAQSVMFGGTKHIEIEQHLPKSLQHQSVGTSTKPKANSGSIFSPTTSPLATSSTSISDTNVAISDTNAQLRLHHKKFRSLTQLKNSSSSSSAILLPSNNHIANSISAFNSTAALRHHQQQQQHLLSEYLQHQTYQTSSSPTASGPIDCTNHLMLASPPTIGLGGDNVKYGPNIDRNGVPINLVGGETKCCAGFLPFATDRATAYILATRQHNRQPPSSHLNHHNQIHANNNCSDTNNHHTVTITPDGQLKSQDALEVVRATIGKDHQLIPLPAGERPTMEATGALQVSTDKYSAASSHPAHKAMAYRCHVCGSGFEDRHRLQQHLSIHLNLHPSWFEEKTIKETMAQYESKRGDYLCTNCNLRFETTAEFDRHMQLHGEKPHMCELCNQDNKLVCFRYYRQLLTHLRSHCFLYSCRFVPDCKQTANRKDYLKLHILKHHLNNKLPEQYTICCH